VVVVPHCGHVEAWFLVTESGGPLDGKSRVCCIGCTRKRVQEIRVDERVVVERIGE
jgi:hypothetical protein